MSLVEDWYDEPEEASTAVDGDFIDDPVDPLDLSRIPGAAGLPIDVDLATILAGADGLASKPDAKAIALTFVEDLRSFVTALMAGLGGDWSQMTTWISEHDDLDWLPDLTNWLPNLIGEAVNLLGGLIPVGLLTQGTPNRLSNGGFDGSVSLEAADGWSHDDAEGHLAAGSATVTGDGARHVLLSDAVAVTEGQALDVSGQVKWSGVAATGSAFELAVREYSGDTVTATTVLDAISNPATSGGWATLDGSHTVAAGVDAVRVMITVTETVTAGTVWWDDLDLHNAATSLPQQWITGLTSALADLWDGLGDLLDNALSALGITPVGSILDRIMDLSDELGAMLGVGEDNASGLDNLLAGLLSNPAALLGALPQSQITNLVGDLGDLNATLNQLGDIFDGAVVTPINSIVAKVKDWWNQWFGGGSTNAIPLSQKGAANGVAPLNSASKLATPYLVTDTANNVVTLDADGKVRGAQLGRGNPDGLAPLNAEAVVPLANLPAEVGGTGGSGAGSPYAILGISASVGIANNTATTVTLEQLEGTATVTFSGDGFILPLAGLWQINYSVAWDGTSTAGNRYAGVSRDNVLVAGNSITGASAPNFGVTERYPRTVISGSALVPYVDGGGGSGNNDDDVLRLRVKHSQGSTFYIFPRNPYGLQSVGTVIECIFLGVTG